MLQKLIKFDENRMVKVLNKKLKTLKLKFIFSCFVKLKYS